MKKENYFVTFIKSFIIGLGIIFPISASYLAVGLGMYQRILNTINNLFKCFKKEYKFIITLILGIGISCLVSCLLINYTLHKYPITTLLFFCGLIIGGIPLLFRKTKKEYKFSNFIWIAVGIIALLGISFLGSGNNAVLMTNSTGLLKILVAGAIGAGSMIIPGVSGSVILVILGYYEPMLEIISQTIKFQNLGANILIIVVFAIGMLIGILIVSKIMEFFLKKYETKSYFAIIGFVSASAIIVIINLFGYTFSLSQFISGIILFIIGFFIAFKFLKEE